MRRRLLGGAHRCLALALTVSGLSMACTIEPPAGTPPPPMSGVLERGPRETAFGRTGDEVVNNPQLRDKIRNMFGTDCPPAPTLPRPPAPHLPPPHAPPR